MIALDAFYSDAVPFHLTTVEFVELVRERLAPGGVLVANVVGALRGPASKLFRSLIRTYRAVFPTVLVHPVFEGAERAQADLRNIMVVATDRPAPERDFLLERCASCAPSGRTSPTSRRPCACATTGSCPRATCRR